MIDEAEVGAVEEGHIEGVTFRIAQEGDDAVEGCRDAEAVVECGEAVGYQIFVAEGERGADVAVAGHAGHVVRKVVGVAKADADFDIESGTTEEVAAHTEGEALCRFYVKGEVAVDIRSVGEVVGRVGRRQGESVGKEVSVAEVQVTVDDFHVIVCQGQRALPHVGEHKRAAFFRLGTLEGDVVHLQTVGRACDALSPHWNEHGDKCNGDKKLFHDVARLEVDKEAAVQLHRAEL